MITNLPDEEAIFKVACQIPAPSARADYLNQVCGHDPAILNRIQSLLRVHEQESRFLISPPPGVAATQDTPAPAESVGMLIGPYKLLEQIGEGGMGLVYMAEQQQPVRRLVALKLVKPGMDSKQVIARFEAERQAVAMMDHPNIAKVHDAGTTETGRPYFVMELVRGMPINEFCDQKRLTVRERLQLFVQVCQAVQHAHQKGIIHRDLKPTNVLVTMADTVAFPKLLDFGIAKALGQSLTDSTLHTGYAQLVGTPLYMSPEQAEMNLFGVDTRSDVYSLGVLLYELLTGTTPFDKETLTKASFDEMRRIIREEEPETVSARIARTKSSRQTPSAVAPSDGTRSVPTTYTELDWIVMKALEKDRSRRYESASALAADIQRYLSDEPVLACPPTTMYRFQKFARKNKPALVTAVAIAVCLILGTTVSAWQAIRATAAEGQAAANEAQAKASSQKAEQKAQEANERRDEVIAVNDQLRRTLYASNMKLAKNAWDEAAVPRVLSLLEQHRPKLGEADLRGFEWHYLNRLTNADVPLTLELRNWFLESVVFSPDGKRLITSHGGGQTSERTNDANERKRVNIDPQLKVWDSESGQELFTLKADNSGVAFSPDGKRLLSASTEIGSATIWNFESGAEHIVLKGHSGRVVALAYSPDGMRLATGSRTAGGNTGAVKIWNAGSGEEIRSLPGDVRGVAFSPDGKRLAFTTGVGQTVYVLDAETGQQLLNLKGGGLGQMGGMNGMNVVFSSDGKRLACRNYWGPGENGIIQEELRVWDAQNGQEITSLREKSDGWLVFAFSPDGKRLAVAGQRGRVPRVKLSNTETGEEIFTFQQHINTIRGLAFSPDGKRLATGSVDGTIRIYDVRTNLEIRTLKGHEVTTLAFSSNGERLACDSYGWATVKVWDLQQGQNPVTQKIQANYGVISSDFQHLAGVGPDNAVKVWDTKSGRQTQAFKGHTNKVSGLAFSPNAKRLVSSDGAPYSSTGDPGLVKLWDVQNGQEYFTLKGHTSGVSTVGASPDGKWLASRGRSGRMDAIKVWDLQTGQELLTIESGPRAFWSTIAFSADSKRLASGSQIWDAASGKELRSLSSINGRVTVFSRDGKRLACSSSDGVRILDAETGDELLTLTGHTGSVVGLAFSPDGNRLTSASTEGTVKVWDASSGHEMLTFEHTGVQGWGSGGNNTTSSHNVAFSADGHRLASILWDGTVRIWDATPLPQ